jgi:hypothetical protein
MMSVATPLLLHDCSNSLTEISLRLKLKRAQAAKAFRADIDRMYAEINNQKPAKGKL